MMTDAELELTILDIAQQGGAVAPINAWEAPVLRLCQQGLLRKVDAFNYVITEAGRAEFDRRENAELMGMVTERNARIVTRNRKDGPIIEGEVLDDDPS